MQPTTQIKNSRCWHVNRARLTHGATQLQESIESDNAIGKRAQRPPTLRIIGHQLYPCIADQAIRPSARSGNEGTSLRAIVPALAAAESGHAILYSALEKPPEALDAG